MRICDRIALAVDFSEPSKVAARGAFEFARLVGAKELALIHTVRPVVMPAESQPVVRERLTNLRERIHTAAADQLAKLCAELGAPPDLAIQQKIIEGHPAEAIVQALGEMQASLLLIGSHARRGVKRLLSGSIAESVLERVRVPTLVLLIGDDGIPPEAELADLAHLLVAIDDSPSSELTARAAFELAKCFARPPKVVLLHAVEGTGIEVIDPDDPEVAAYAKLLEERGRERAHELAARCGGDGLEVEVRIEYGPAAETILEVANRLPARIVAVGTRGSRVGALIGSTATHVVRHSNVPVLVVPHPEE